MQGLLAQYAVAAKSKAVESARMTYTDAASRRKGFACDTPPIRFWLDVKLRRAPVRGYAEPRR